MYVLMLYLYTISTTMSGMLTTANVGYYNSHTCGYSGNFSPVCHLPLGLKIALGAPFLPIGIWFGWRGLSAADWRNPHISHALWCALRLIAGGVIATLGLLVMIL